MIYYDELFCIYPIPNDIRSNGTIDALQSSWTPLLLVVFSSMCVCDQITFLNIANMIAWRTNKYKLLQQKSVNKNSPDTKWSKFFHQWAVDLKSPPDTAAPRRLGIWYRSDQRQIEPVKAHQGRRAVLIAVEPYTSFSAASLLVELHRLLQPIWMSTFLLVSLFEFE